MRLRLVVVGLLVLAPVGCSDAADGLVDRSEGEITFREDLPGSSTWTCRRGG